MHVGWGGGGAIKDFLRSWPRLCFVNSFPSNSRCIATFSSSVNPQEERTMRFPMDCSSWEVRSSCSSSCICASCKESANSCRFSSRRAATRSLYLSFCWSLSACHLAPWRRKIRLATSWGTSPRPAARHAFASPMRSDTKTCLPAMWLQLGPLFCSLSILIFSGEISFSCGDIEKRERAARMSDLAVIVSLPYCGCNFMIWAALPCCCSTEVVDQLMSRSSLRPRWSSCRL